jgi:hypothetical protein
LWPDIQFCFHHSVKKSPLHFFDSRGILKPEVYH